MEQSKNYADENNLTLIESIDGRRLEDIGVSAFNGKNATDGVLSIFLKHLESGNIEKDSVLLVESLDRLSGTSKNTSFHPNNESNGLIYNASISRF